ncbi:MAG TPA: XTP/dITP diphosphatase [Candidatus Thermoplasmatota archaeon]|nr:XTP/dITP diphosphatase [Candidatus Thermoplasmatota archaeon]
MKTLYFITSNKGKVHEVTEKLKQFNYKIIQKNYGYPEIQTETLEEVARFGVNHFHENNIEHPFILEDAGIFIDALKGFPGVYSSYVYFTIGLDGILKLMKSNPYEKRTAQFKSVFAYGNPEGDYELFVGTCNGSITTKKQGSRGFGYDPIFKPNGFQKTFAELETSEKNQVSHRAQSLEKLVTYLKEL